MFTIKTKSKMLKAQWKEFSLKEYMHRNRYVGSYPKLKRFVLVNFLFVVIGFIGWNISVNMPQVSFKWSSDPVTFERPVHAEFTVKEEIIEDIEVTDCYSASKVMSKKYSVPEELMNKIIKAESNNNPLVENKVSTATGCAQFVIASWRNYGKELWNNSFYEKSVYSAKDNVELMAYVISQHGTSPWDSSKSSWSK